MKRIVFVAVIAVSLLLSACESTREQQPVQTPVPTVISKTEVKREYIPSEHYLMDVWNKYYGTGWSYHIKETEEDLFYIVKEGIVHKSKETGKTELIISGEDYSITTMYIKDDKIYYSVSIDIIIDDVDSRTSQVFSADLNGENRKMIFDGRDYLDFKFDELPGLPPLLYDVDEMYIDNDILYIRESIDSFLYDIKMDNVKLFSRNIRSSAFSGDKFYFTDHAEKTFSVYEQDINTGEVKLVRGDGIGKRGNDVVIERDTEMFDYVFGFDGKIYYTERFPARLYQYNPDGKDYLIADFDNDDTESWYKNTLSVSVGYDRFYYIFGKDLYEYNPENNGTKKLCTIQDIQGNGGYYGFIVSGGMIAYTKEDETQAYIKLEDLQR